MRTYRVMYFTGPGDIVRTFRHWRQAEKDPQEIAETYSGRFYSLMRDHGWRARAISMCSHVDIERSGDIEAENRPPPDASAGGLWYYLARLVYESRQVLEAVWWRADVVIVTTPVHWWLFVLPRLFGVRVVASVHCTFWTGSEPAGSKAQRLQRWLAGWFWRHGPVATLCISNEIAKQIRQIAGEPRGDLIVCTPAFERSSFEGLALRTWRHKHMVLYSGRIMKTKGVWDLLEAALAIEMRRPGLLRWVVCGDGPELEKLRHTAHERGLEGRFECPGHVDRDRLRLLLEEATIVAAPTQRGFFEGLNKSVIEGALAGVPVVTTDVVPAKDVVGGAALIVPADDPDELGRAIERLATEEPLWTAMAQAAVVFRERFFAEDRSWGVELGRVLERILSGWNGARAPV